MGPKKFIRILCALWNRCRYLRYLHRNKPIPFVFRSHTYYLNPDQSAIYHIENSTAKIARMVDLIESAPNCVFDVGAHCGLFSAFISKKFPDCNVFCFEPSEELIPIINSNCSQCNLTILNCAISDQDEHRTLYVNPKSQQTNSLNEDAVTLFASKDIVEKRTIRCRSLDSIAKEYNIKRVDVLKVDVQGFEGAVFRGAKALLSTVEHLFIESTWIDVDSITQIIPFALSYGFQYAAVINPVYMGADVLLSKQPIKQRKAVELIFPLNEELLTSRWR